MRVESIYKRGVGREHPKGHLIQLLAAIIFFLLWILDSFVFILSIDLIRYIPNIINIIRIVLFIIFLIMGLFLIFRTGYILFHEEMPSSLIKTGIFAHTRHPLYLGVLIIYIGLILLSVSLISIVGFIIAFLLYNWIANFEEKDLEEIFKEEYLEYKKKVPKWIPSIKHG